MKTFSITLMLLLLTVPVFAQKTGVATWDANTDLIDGYRLGHGHEGGPYSQVAEVTAGSNTATVTVSQDDGSCFVVWAFRGTEESGYSNEDCFGVDIPTSLTIIMQ
jgi:hypothetical protein